MANQMMWIWLRIFPSQINTFGGTRCFLCMLKICARAAIVEVWAKKEFWCLTDLMRNLKNYVLFLTKIYFQSNWILKLRTPYWLFPYPIDKISFQYKKCVITEIKHSITRQNFVLFQLLLFAFHTIFS